MRENRENPVKERIRTYLQKRRQSKLFYTVIAVLACIVVYCTGMGLRYYGHALTNDEIDEQAEEDIDENSDNDDKEDEDSDSDKEQEDASGDEKDKVEASSDDMDSDKEDSEDKEKPSEDKKPGESEEEEDASEEDDTEDKSSEAEEETGEEETETETETDAETETETETESETETEELLVKECKTGKVKVTASYGKDAEIPEDAEFIVKEITRKNDKEHFEDREEEINEKDKDTYYSLLYLLDIGFYVDDEEIEPKAPVDIQIEFLDEKVYDDDAEISVMHFGEKETDLVKEVEYEDGTTTFQADSFSEYAIMLAAGSLPANKYGNYTFSYDVDKYKYFYQQDTPLGMAGNFHIVAFHKANINVHTNGNILTSELDARSDFGTRDWKNEVSYAKKIINFTGQVTNDAKTGILVIGKEHDLFLSDNNNHINIVKANRDGYVQVNSPNTIVQERENSYINLDKVKEEVVGISNMLAEFDQNTGVSVIKKDGNQRLELKLDNKDAVGVYHFKSNEISQIGDYLKVYGFEDNHKGTVIFNVDCSDNKSNSIKIPRVYTMIAGKSSPAGTGEIPYDKRNNYQNNKIIWNFTNCKGKTIEARELVGVLLAPEASLKVWNMNGIIIGDNVTVEGETHREDFVGELPSGCNISENLTAKKLVDGKTPNADVNGKFHFLLEKWDGSSWAECDETSNDGGNIKFELSYTKGDIEKTFFYLLSEKDEKDTAYSYDKTRYLYAVKVNGNNQNEIKRYKINPIDQIDKNALIKNNAINEAYLKQLDGNNQSVSENDIVFNNNSVTSISIEKIWKNNSNDLMLEGEAPISVVLQLVRTIDKNVPVEVGEPVPGYGPIQLYYFNNWKHTYTNLPKYDANGNLYYYSMKEIDVVEIDKEIIDSGKNHKYVLRHYKGSYYPGPWVTDSKITLVNQKMFTDITVKKNWVTGDLPIPVNEVKFKLYQTKIKSNGSKEPAVEYGEYSITATDNWQKYIDNLPYSDEQGNNFTYYVEELSQDNWEVTYQNNENVKTGTITITNTLTNLDFQLQKQWFTEDGQELAVSNELYIEVEIYQSETAAKTGNDEYLGTFYLKENEAGRVLVPNDKPIKDEYKNLTVGQIPSDSSPNSFQRWSLLLKGLPIVNKDSNQPYYYYAKEVIINGKTLDMANYEVHHDEIPVRTETFFIKNIGGHKYELPETGGKGSIWFQIKMWFLKLFQ